MLLYGLDASLVGFNPRDVRSKLGVIFPGLQHAPRAQILPVRLTSEGYFEAAV